MGDVIEDGHGNAWVRCSPSCDMEVVRPGKVQCSCDEETVMLGGDTIARLTRERDEALAEVERLRAGLREVRRMALLVLRGHRCARCGVWDRPDDPRPELSAECHLRRACEEAEALLASAETEATDERQ